jgi:hypothetical protein
MTDYIKGLRQDAQAFLCATSREEIGKLYAQLVGHDCAADDPDADIEDLRQLGVDYVKECCYSRGIHCRQVGLTP